MKFTIQKIQRKIISKLSNCIAEIKVINMKLLLELPL